MWKCKKCNAPYSSELLCECELEFFRKFKRRRANTYPSEQTRHNHSDPSEQTRYNHSDGEETSGSSRQRNSSWYPSSESSESTLSEKSRCCCSYSCSCESEIDEDWDIRARECRSGQSHTNRDQPVKWNWFGMLFSKIFPCINYATEEVPAYSCRILNYIAVFIIIWSFFNPLSDYISNGRLLVIGIASLVLSHLLFRNVNFVFSLLLSCEVLAFIQEYFFINLNLFYLEPSWYSFAPYFQSHFHSMCWWFNPEMWFYLTVIIFQYFIFTTKTVVILENSSARRLAVPLLFFVGLFYFLWKMVNKYIHYSAVNIGDLIIFAMLVWAGIKLIFV